MNKIFDESANIRPIDEILLEALLDYSFNIENFKEKDLVALMSCILGYFLLRRGLA